jgi:hypothetical protein
VSHWRLAAGTFSKDSFLLWGAVLGTGGAWGLSSIPGLYPLDASGTPTPQVGTTENVSLGQKHYWFRTTGLRNAR